MGVSCLLYLPFFFLLLPPAYTRLIDKPTDTEVAIGDDTYFNCSTSDPSKEVHWYHYLVGSGKQDNRYVYAHGQMHPPFDERFRIEKSGDGAFDLRLTNVEPKDAGLYVCQDDGGTGEYSQAELIVLYTPLVCQTNASSDGVIGSNSCGIKEELIRLSCALRYEGNKPPTITWKIEGDVDVVERANFSYENSGNYTSYHMTTEAKVTNADNTYVCQTVMSRSSQYNCTSNVKVLYAVANQTFVEKHVGDEVVCRPKTNLHTCSYEWKWVDGVNERVVTEDRQLKLTQTGNHRCQATCVVRHRQCSFLAMVVYGSSFPAVGKQEEKSIVVAVVVTIILYFAIAAAIGVLAWKRITGKTETLRKLMDDKYDILENKMKQYEKVQEFPGTPAEMPEILQECSTYSEISKSAKTSNYSRSDEVLDHVPTWDGSTTASLPDSKDT